MIYSLFTNIGIWNLGFSIVQIGQLLFGQTEKALFQNLFLAYMSETGILWGVRKIHSIFTKSSPSKKHPLPIPIKIAVCTPSWEQCLPFVYRNPVLQMILSPNSHRKAENKPLLKNIPHLYEKNRGFYTPFWGLSTICLQFVYKNRPCEQKLRHGHHQDLKMRSCLLY